MLLFPGVRNARTEKEECQRSNVENLLSVFSLRSRFRAEAPSLTDERSGVLCVVRAASLRPPRLRSLYSTAQGSGGEEEKGKGGGGGSGGVAGLWRRGVEERAPCQKDRGRKRNSSGSKEGGKGGRGAPPNALETDKKGEGGECGEKMRTNAPLPPFSNTTTDCSYKLVLIPSADRSEGLPQGDSSP